MITTSRARTTRIVGCLAIALIVLAIVHGCSQEPLSTEEAGTWQDTPIRHERPDPDIPDPAQEEARIWRHEEPAPATTPEPPDPIGSPESVADQPAPDEVTAGNGGDGAVTARGEGDVRGEDAGTAGDGGDAAAIDEDGGDGTDLAQANGGVGGENGGGASSVDSTRQDGSTGAETAEADDGMGTEAAGAGGGEDDAASTDQDSGTGPDAADGGATAEDAGAAGGGDDAAVTGQDGSAGDRDMGDPAGGGSFDSEDGAATGDQSSPTGEESADDMSDDERLRDMLAMLDPGDSRNAEEPAPPSSPPSNGQSSEGRGRSTEGQDTPSDNVAEADGASGGMINVPQLPTPPPLPPAEDVSSVEGTVVPEDAAPAQESITGVWRQVGGSGAADFLPGGYVASEFTFLADGTVRIRRTFDEDGDVVMTWRVSYEWNEDQSELTIGSDADSRPDPASLKGFTIQESNVHATPATQDLPCTFTCVRSDDGQIRLDGKTYAPAE